MTDKNGAAAPQDDKASAIKKREAVDAFDAFDAAIVKVVQATDVLKRLVDDMRLQRRRDAHRADPQ